MNFLSMLQKGDENPYRDIMPPVLGTDEDLKALAAYLEKEVGVLSGETISVQTE